MSSDMIADAAAEQPEAAPTMAAPSSLRLRPPEDYDGKRDAAAVSRWLFKMSYYCTCTSVPEDKWTMVAGFHLSGKALDWWQHHLTQNPMPTWDKFSDAIKTKFVPAMDLESAKDKLHECRQRTTAARYVQEFDDLRLLIPDSSFDLNHAFVWGLKPELKARVRIEKPASLEDAQQLAIMLDEALYPHLFKSSPSFSPSSHHPRPAPLRSAPPRNALPRSTLHRPPYQQTSPMELDAIDNQQPVLARNGRPITCFRCGKPGHMRDQCPLNRAAQGQRPAPPRPNFNLLEELPEDETPESEN